MATAPYAASGIDDFLDEKGVSDQTRLAAIREVVAWQLAQLMTEQNLSTRMLAALMHTSRDQIDSVLDPAEGNVTIATLQRAAAVLGRKLQVELV